MSIRSFLLKYFIKNDKILSHRSSFDELTSIISCLRPVQTGHDLIRIGGPKDGGYLLPDDIEGIGYCFSPGVSDSARFEEELAARYGIKSFLADASVDSSPVQSEMLDFEKKFLGGRNQGDFIRLSDWMEQKLPPGDPADLILQMDIEGAEYEVLIDASIETLKRFRIIVLELHELDMMGSRNAARFLRPILEKLTSEFAVAHIHPNNYRPPVMIHGIPVPKIVEITLLRRDRLLPATNSAPLQYPHPLDSRNVPSQPDVVLPDFWWKPEA